MTTKDFIKQALQGKTRKQQCSSVFISDDTVYSYGYHYPLAKIIGGYAFVNNRGYSVTTAKHIGWAHQAVSDIVGYDNVYSVPLTNGDSLTAHDIAQSAGREADRLKKLMESKKRKDTQVYQDLARQLDDVMAALLVTAGM